MFTLELEKGLGETYCNTVRQLAYTCIPVLRPIAYTLGRGTTILTAGDCVQEDMVALGSSLSKLVYSPKGAVQVGAIIPVEYTLSSNGVLSDTDLATDSVQVIGATGAEILHSANGESVVLTVYYSYNKGSRTNTENRELVLDAAKKTVDFVAIASRHCDIAKFTVTKQRDSFTTDKMAICIESKTGIHESFIWNKSVDLLQLTAEKLKVAYA